MVKRYDIEYCGNGYDSYRDMVEYHDGEYVLSEDYDREITRLREQLADAEKVIYLFEETAKLANHPDPDDRSWEPASDLLDEAFNEYRKKYGGRR